MSTYEHRGYVSPTDLKDEFDLEFEINPDYSYKGSYEVHNHNEHGRFRFIIENAVLRDKDGILYDHEHWEEDVKRTLTPGDKDSGTFGSIMRTIYPTPVYGSNPRFKIKLKWIATSYTRKVEYHLIITSDNEFEVDP